MNKVLSKAILFSCFLPLAIKCAAQLPSFDFKKIKSQFPTEDACFITDRAMLNIALENSKLEISLRVDEQVLFLNDMASRFSGRSVSFYEETENISDVEAASYVPLEDGRMKKIPVEKTFVGKPRKGNIFYDDMKEISINFPSLRQGAVSSLSYERRYKDPHFIPTFFFGNNSPTRQSEYSVTFPKEVKIGYVMKGDTAGLTFTRKESKGQITYTWKATDCPSYMEVQEAGEWRRRVPHVIVYIHSYNSGQREELVLSDLKQLYRWYFGHIKNLQEEQSQEVKQLADSLTKGLKTDEEKIKAIYYWVQENIKYIAFEYGLGGFVPRKASVVCSRRFGDCKDKSSLLYAMLKSAGVRSYFTWIGTREIPYSYSEVHTPIADNHMILSVHQNGNWIFLDGTAQGLPYGYPSDFIQDKEALISVSADSFIVVKVPVTPYEKNSSMDSLAIKIDGTDIIGRGTSIYAGLWKSDVANDFRNTASNKKLENAKDYFTFGSNKCELDSFSDQGLEDYTESARFNYLFKVPGFARKVDGRLYVNLNLTRQWHGDLIDVEKKKTSVHYRYKYTMKQFVVLEIPAGFRLAKLPSPAKYDSASFGFEISYRTGNNSVFLEKKIWMNELVRDRSGFADWNTMIQSLDDAYAQMVVLEGKQ